MKTQEKQSFFPQMLFLMFCLSLITCVFIQKKTMPEIQHYLTLPSTAFGAPTTRHILIMFGTVILSSITLSFPLEYLFLKNSTKETQYNAYILCIMVFVISIAGFIMGSLSGYILAGNWKGVWIGSDIGSVSGALIMLGSYVKVRTSKKTEKTE